MMMFSHDTSRNGSTRPRMLTAKLQKSGETLPGFLNSKSAPIFGCHIISVVVVVVVVAVVVVVVLVVVFVVVVVVVVVDPVGVEGLPCPSSDGLLTGVAVATCLGLALRAFRLAANSSSCFLASPTSAESCITPV